MNGGQRSGPRCGMNRRGFSRGRTQPTENGVSFCLSNSGPLNVMTRVNGIELNSSVDAEAEESFVNDVIV